jgi:hypothetical protein
LCIGGSLLFLCTIMYELKFILGVVGTRLDPSSGLGFGDFRRINKCPEITQNDATYTSGLSHPI